MTVLTLVLGVLGHAAYAQDHGLPSSFSGNLYMTLQLFILHAPHLEPPVDRMLDVARFLAIGILGYGATLALLSGFGRFLRLDAVRGWKDHVVIGGGGEEALLLARGFLAANDRVVVVAARHDEALEEIYRMGAAVLIGNPGDRLLRSARIEGCRHLIAATGDDGANIELATRAAGLLTARGGRPSERPLECSIHLGDATLRSTIRRDPNALPNAGGRMRVEVVGLDLFENSARLLFGRHALDHAPIADDSTRQVHLIVCYFGQMGEAVLLQAARIGVFANRRPLKLSVLQSPAWLEPHRSEFLRRYPAITELCELQFVGCDADDPELLPRLAAMSQTDDVVSFAFCEPHDAHNLSLGLKLLEATPGQKSQILLRMRSRRGLAPWVEQQAARQRFGGRMHAFGMIEDICTRDQLLRGRLDTIARCIHADFVAQRRAEGRGPGDPSMAAWDQLMDDFKESCRQQADHLPVKLRALGLCLAPAASAMPTGLPFTSAQVETLARMEHQRWIVERRLAGWKLVPREASPQKARRESPYLVPWEELDESVRDYDRQAVLAIPRILGAVGLGVFQDPGRGA